MKQIDIKTNKTYTDGKKRRKVICITLSHRGSMSDWLVYDELSPLGNVAAERKCFVYLFARWAKSEMDE